MKKVICVLVLVATVNMAMSQTGASATNMLKEEQQRFIRHLKTISVDSVIVYPLARYFDSEVNSIYSYINDVAFLPTVEKEKAIRSLVYFMTQLSNNMVKQKIDVYDIPGALQSYRELLAALLNHKPVTKILTPLSPRRTQLLASAFSQYPEFAEMDELAVYKRIASTPEFIVQFLETKPNFRYADSLILQAATYNPQKLISYIHKGNGQLQSRIKNNKNRYLQQMILLSDNKNASELLPFVIQIADSKLMEEDIMAARPDVTKYFQLLVNTLMESSASADTNTIFLKLLRDGVKQKSLAFYVNQINELHTSPDAVRFASAKNLRPEDIYYVITSCGDELYTSSYLGLYKRLMEKYKDQPADALFDLVRYDNFNTFLRLTANYNVATDFFTRVSPDRRGELLHRFMSGIETNANSGLDRAMDIADFFSGLDVTAEINGLIQTELQANLNRCNTQHQYLGIRLYSVLLQVFDLVRQRGPGNKLWASLGNYEILKSSELQNKNQEIVELVLFYGDEDGKASFNSFQKLYADSSKWRTMRNANWINIVSVSGQAISIFANLPLDEEEELDLHAQDDLDAYLKQNSLQPTVLVHRGHSYHLDKTLKRLEPSVKLAILGSCGSYNKSISIASINPDIQVIGSKKTGSKSINDPIIDVINNTLLQKNDLEWSDIWGRLRDRFSKDQATLTLFNEYFKPDDNLSLFVLKLFSL